MEDQASIRACIPTAVARTSARALAQPPLVHACRWPKAGKPSPESSCVLELKKGRGDLVLEASPSTAALSALPLLLPSCLHPTDAPHTQPSPQVVFSNKASLPQHLRLSSGPKAIGPFTPACAELTLPNRTKHQITLPDSPIGDNRFLRVLFTGTQAHGQGEAHPKRLALP